MATFTPLPSSPGLHSPGRASAGVVLAGLCAAVVLQGCSTVPAPRSTGSSAGRPAPSATAPGSAGSPAPGASPSPAPSSGSTAPSPREVSALATERQWLQSWFKDTPVNIAENAGALSVDVPREFSFDPGRSELKPPLIAVLDKVSQSLRRVPLARLELVAAPEDDRPGAAAPPLATQRAAQVRRYLIGRGVAASRLDAPSATRTAAVQLRMELAAP